MLLTDNNLHPVIPEAWTSIGDKLTAMIANTHIHAQVQTHTNMHTFIARCIGIEWNEYITMLNIY